MSQQQRCAHSQGLKHIKIYFHQEKNLKFSRFASCSLSLSLSLLSQPSRVLLFYIITEVIGKRRVWWGREMWGNLLKSILMLSSMPHSAHGKKYHCIFWCVTESFPQSGIFCFSCHTTLFHPRNSENWGIISSQVWVRYQFHIFICSQCRWLIFLRAFPPTTIWYLHRIEENLIQFLSAVFFVRDHLVSTLIVPTHIVNLERNDSRRSNRVNRGIIELRLWMTFDICNQ